MESVRLISDLKKRISEVRREGQTVGFVPTMGFLHEGHLSLVREARRECDFVVISIFVNPIQFDAGWDYDDYPRDLEADRRKAEQEGCDLVFYPGVKEMYPGDYATYVEVARLTEGLCGANRPGHFRGVTTVVTKLFNLVEPDIAYFGQKDAQQAVVIQKMVEDLNMNLEVRVLPTVREEDGLAMSSRNAYLSPPERRAATVLYRALNDAVNLVNKGGEKQAEMVRGRMVQTVDGEPLARLEYAAVVSGADLSPLEILEGKILLALAVRIGKTRLIDNMVLEV